jgi:hypothetical protein
MAAVDCEDGTISRRSMIAAAGGGLGLLASTVGAGPASAEPEGAATYGAPDPAIPSLGLRWAFSARIFFADRFMIDSPVPRGYTSVGAGEVWGPRLQGRVLPHSGADYYKTTFNTYYMLEASDGVLIFIHNRGSKRRFKAWPAPGQDPIPDPGVDPNAPGGWVRFRAAPTFTAPVGPHEWLNSTVFVANAAKHAHPDHTVFTYYEVI